MGKIYTQIEGARLMTYNAARLKEEGTLLPATIETVLTSHRQVDLS